jgi:hypothetical protein
MGVSERIASRSVGLIVATFVLHACLALDAACAVTIQPASPTSNDEIIALIDVRGGCFVTSSTVVNGNSIRTDVLITDCAVGPPPFTVIHGAPFGPLPAGTYTYEVYTTTENDPPVLEAQLTIIVTAAAAAAAVPALGQLGYGILTVLLVLTALVMVRRV